MKREKIMSILTMKEMTEARDRAKDRAKNSLVVREELRLCIDGYDLIDRIQTVSRMLFHNRELDDDGLSGVPSWVTPRALTPHRVAQIKAAADIDMALLRKVLPDIRAVELTGKNGDPIAFEETIPALSKIALRQHIRYTLEHGADEPEITDAEIVEELPSFLR